MDTHSQQSGGARRPTSRTLSRGKHLLELIRFAAARGIEIHVAHLGEDVLGYWSPDEGRIYYDFMLTPNEASVTVGHELGHAHYGHRCDSSRNEYQADHYAASLLIDPDAYAEIEALNPDQHHIADELSVTVELVDFFEQNCLTRLRGVTYVRARHGRSQAALRRFTPRGLVHG